MRFAILYGAQGLAARGSLELDGYRDDPRGLTGSEYGAVRIVELLSERGHDVDLYAGVPPGADEHYDVAIALNEPDLLRDVSADFRVCEFWVNGFTHCRVGFHEHCDLFVSPSVPHLRMVLDQWRDVEMTPSGPRGRYEAESGHEKDKWVAIMLGHDVTKAGPKVPGRCVYLSSPDRGLHRLLEMWPAIKESCPWATLHILYRLQPWIDGLKGTPYFPPIEKNRRRALYIEDALRRMQEHGGLEERWGITVLGSVSRNRVDQELSEAEVMPYPCETISWSEGFSCSTLEACAAGCAVVITDCDAFAEVYRELGPIPVGSWRTFANEVVLALNGCNSQQRPQRGTELAAPLTWSRHVDMLLKAIERRKPA